MNSYQTEQFETLTMIRRHLRALSEAEKNRLTNEINDYLHFRNEVQAFLSEHFRGVCTQRCFQSSRSACCSKDGIITFFADMVINALVTPDERLDLLEAVLQQKNDGHKCTYLSKEGCLWQIKPIVCEMFLCDAAKEEIFGRKPGTRRVWNELTRRRKKFTWPDRPILFDRVEAYFKTAGYTSPLMYMHNSPGLLKVKKQVRHQ